MIAAALLSCALKAAVLLSVAWFGAFVVRKASAAVRHFLWICAVFSVGLLPLLQAIPFGWRDLRTAGELSARQSNAVPQAASQVSSFVVNAIDSLPRHTNVNRWILVLWFAGLTSMLMRLLASWIVLERSRRSARPCSDAGLLTEAVRCAQAVGVNRLVSILILSGPCNMPSTFGLFRPVILLPPDFAQWTAHRLRIVLLHEMSHIRRNDWAAGMLAQVCLAMYWFHPLVWNAVRQLREESECAADDVVLAAGEDASIYADELLGIIRSSLGTRGVSATAIAMARSNQLERRITAMLNETIDRRHLTWKARLFTSTAALLALIPISALQSPAQNSPGTFGGTVLDPRGAAVPATTVIATNRATRSRDMTATDSNGVYHFDGLPAGEYEIRFLKPGFAEHRESSMLPALGGSTQNVTLELGSLSETINVVAHEGGNAAAESTAPQRIVIGGSVQAANLIRQVKPPYPESAKAARLQGAVILEATIGSDGIPNSLQVMNAHIDPDMARAAIEAVNQWRYRPTLLNGQPVEVRTNITVNFTLAN